jgi:hypothetical protein
VVVVPTTVKGEIVDKKAEIASNVLSRIQKVVKEVEDSTMTKVEKKFRKMQEAATEAKKQRIEAMLAAELLKNLVPKSRKSKVSPFEPERSTTPDILGKTDHDHDHDHKETLISSCEELEKKSLHFLGEKTPDVQSDRDEEDEDENNNLID